MPGYKFRLLRPIVHYKNRENGKCENVKQLNSIRNHHRHCNLVNRTVIAVAPIPTSSGPPSFFAYRDRIDFRNEGPHGSINRPVLDLIALSRRILGFLPDVPFYFLNISTWLSLSFYAHFSGNYNQSDCIFFSRILHFCTPHTIINFSKAVR